VADHISKNLAWPVFGVMLILSVWVMPNGAAGFLARLGERLERWRA